MDPDANTISLAQALVRRDSVTPDDAGCQALIAGLLAPAGFTIESMRFGEVDNLWARHGEGEPSLVFAGHTDDPRTSGGRRRTRRASKTACSKAGAPPT